MSISNETNQFQDRQSTIFVCSAKQLLMASCWLVRLSGSCLTTQPLSSFEPTSVSELHSYEFVDSCFRHPKFSLLFSSGVPPHCPTHSCLVFLPCVSSLRLFHSSLLLHSLKYRHNRRQGTASLELKNRKLSHETFCDIKFLGPFSRS